MDEWWHSLPMILQGFYCIAILGSLVFALQTVLMVLGAGHTGFDHAAFDSSGGSADSADHGHTGLGMLSLRTFVAFTTGLGWVGVLVTEQGGPLWLASLLGVLAGGLFAWSLVWMMRSMARFSSDGSLNYANAVGAVGTVIVAVQPGGRGGGQIEVMVQGRLAAVQAIGAGEAAIPSGTKVRVTELCDPTTLRVIPA